MAYELTRGFNYVNSGFVPKFCYNKTILTLMMFNSRVEINNKLLIL